MKEVLSAQDLAWRLGIPLAYTITGQAQHDPDESESYVTFTPTDWQYVGTRKIGA